MQQEDAMCGCDKLLLRAEFPESQIHNAGDRARNVVPRCSLCHTCDTCHIHRDARSFAEQAKECIACTRKTEASRCEACNKQKAAADFSKKVLEHAALEGRRRVCLPCFALGFTPRDVEAYRCAECGERGHMKFDRKALEHHKARGRRLALVCSDCVDRHRNIERTFRDKSSIRCTCKGKQKDRVHDFSNLWR